MMIVLLIVLAVVGFVFAATLFGADSRSFDTRRNMPDWPGARHSS